MEKKVSKIHKEQDKEKTVKAKKRITKKIERTKTGDKLPFDHKTTNPQLVIKEEEFEQIVENVDHHVHCCVESHAKVEVSSALTISRQYNRIIESRLLITDKENPVYSLNDDELIVIKENDEKAFIEELPLSKIIEVIESSKPMKYKTTQPAKAIVQTMDASTEPNYEVLNEVGCQTENIYDNDLLLYVDANPGSLTRIKKEMKHVKQVKETKHKKMNDEKIDESTLLMWSKKSGGPGFVTDPSVEHTMNQDDVIKNKPLLVSNKSMGRMRAFDKWSEQLTERDFFELDINLKDYGYNDDDDND